MGEYTKPKSDFVYEDTVVPTKNVILVVHAPDEATLDVWMPRQVTDCFTVAMREALLEAIADFIRNVPVRKC